MAIPATGTSLQGDNSHNAAPGVTSRQFSRKVPWLQRRGSPRKAARTTPGLWEGKVVVLIHPPPSSRSARSCTRPYPAAGRPMIVVSQHKTPPGFLLPGRRAVHLDAGGLKAWGAFLPPREVLPPADVAHEKLSLPELRGQHGGFLPPPVTPGRSRNPSLDGKRPPAAMRWAVALEGVTGVPTGRGMRRAVPRSRTLPRAAR